MDENQNQGHGFSGSTFNTPSQDIKPANPYTEPDHQLPDHALPDPMPAASVNVGRAATVSSVYPSADEEFKQGPNLVQQVAEPRSSFSMPSDDRPIPVVKVLSVRGVEYAMMSILLWFGAGTLIFLIDTLIMGSSSFDLMAFPISLLLVCMPGFAFFYLRLRKAELEDPSLRLEASKRRFSQITQILAFLTCFFNIVGLVYILVGLAGGNDVNGIGKIIGSIMATVVIAGGILVYYWNDEHKFASR